MSSKMLLLIIVAIIVLFGNSSQFRAYGLKEVTSQKVIIKHKAPPVFGKINEVELAGGEQKYIYFIIKNAQKVIWVGLNGYIYNNSSKKNIIGKFKIISVVNDFVKGMITELNNTIGTSAYVEIEIDRCCLIK